MHVQRTAARTDGDYSNPGEWPRAAPAGCETDATNILMEKNPRGAGAAKDVAAGVREPARLYLSIADCRQLRPPRLSALDRRKAHPRARRQESLPSVSSD